MKIFPFAFESQPFLLLVKCVLAVLVVLMKAHYSSSLLATDSLKNCWLFGGHFVLVIVVVIDSFENCWLSVGSL